MRKLTKKQAVFVAEIVKGRNATKAAQTAYKTKNENTAAVMGHENLRKPKIAEALAPILEKHNISIETAIEPIGKALTAKKIDIVSGTEKDDLDLQLKASDRARDLLGIGKNQDSPNIHFHQHIHDQAQKYQL